MGGISFVVGFESIADPPGDPGALREALWEHATSILYRYLGRPGNRDVLYYASEELHDRAEQGVRGSDIRFTFMDCAGCCNRSMDAAHHWMEVAFALDRPGFERAAEKSGFRLTGRSPSVATLVRQGSDPVFMHIGDKLWAVGRRAPGSPLEELWGDSAGLEVAELSEKDRAVAERISLTGRCHCELCSHARKIVKPKKPRGQKTETPFDDKALDANIPKAEALLASEGAKARIDAAIKDLKAWGDAEWAGAPAGPPAFQELQGWLASEGAPIATIGLTGTLFYIDARARRGY